MISLNYLGVDGYEVFLGSKTVILTTSELESICNAVLADNINFEIPTRDLFEEKVSDYEFELNVLKSKISDHIGNIEELIDDEETEPIHLIRELEAIKKVIEESE